MVGVRPPAVAGSFYAAEAEELKRELKECLVASPLGPRGVTSPSPSLLGGMVPHAGYAYSGPCAAHLYSCLVRDVGCVVIVGVNHRGNGTRVALSSAEYWETPLGRVEVDQELGRLLQTQIDILESDDRSHLREHSIEVQLPFLQSILEPFTFLPISLSYISEQECDWLGHAIAHVVALESASKKKTVLLASSDLNHYLSPKETERLDRLALDQVLSLNPAGLLKTVEEEGVTMCGVFPVAVVLFAAKALGARKVRLLKHCHSGDTFPMREVVGYASVAIEL
ncbi:MAG: AmmeMemoRadiSam system protein B [Candidatus Binatia bacterium]